MYKYIYIQIYIYKYNMENLYRYDWFHNSLFWIFSKKTPRPTFEKAYTLYHVKHTHINTQTHTRASKCCRSVLTLQTTFRAGNIYIHSSKKKSTTYIKFVQRHDQSCIHTHTHTHTHKHTHTHTRTQKTRITHRSTYCNRKSDKDDFKAAKVPL